MPEIQHAGNQYGNPLAQYTQSFVLHARSFSSILFTISCRRATFIAFSMAFFMFLLFRMDIESYLGLYKDSPMYLEVEETQDGQWLPEVTVKKHADCDFNGIPYGDQRNAGRAKLHDDADIANFRPFKLFDTMPTKDDYYMSRTWHVVRDKSCILTEFLDINVCISKESVRKTQKRKLLPRSEQEREREIEGRRVQDTISDSGSGYDATTTERILPFSKGERESKSIGVQYDGDHYGDGATIAELKMSHSERESRRLRVQDSYDGTGGSNAAIARKSQQSGDEAVTRRQLISSLTSDRRQLSGAMLMVHQNMAATSSNGRTSSANLRFKSSDKKQRTTSNDMKQATTKKLQLNAKPNRDRMISLRGTTTSNKVQQNATPTNREVQLYEDSTTSSRRWQLQEYNSSAIATTKRQLSLFSADTVHCLPSYMIIGFQKCATTELMLWLSYHPNINS
jgi:hypothetical protein